MTKSVKVKIIIIIVCISLSAIIMTYKYFTDFRQTQIDRQEKEAVAWDSPINQFEFAGQQDTPQNNQEEAPSSISKIDTNPKAFLQITYSTAPFVKVANAQEMADKVAAYGKDPAIENFIKDMDKALGNENKETKTLPSQEELEKQLNSTQIQKILLQYSKDPAFIKAMQQAMADPAFATGFVNYIQKQTEQQSSK